MTSCYSKVCLGTELCRSVLRVPFALQGEAKSEEGRVMYSAGKETQCPEEDMEFSASLGQGTASWGWVGMLTALYAINRFQICQASQLGFQWGVCQMTLCLGTSQGSRTIVHVQILFLGYL